jgi:hypothetical protein
VPQAGRTIQRATLSQAVGSGDLIPTPGAGARIYIVSLIITALAASTVKFTCPSGDLTAVHDLAANGGLQLGKGAPASVVMETLQQNEKVSVTVGGTGPVKVTARYFVSR